MATKVEKAANYTVEQENAIRAAAPLNLEKAKVLAEQFGKNYRSVIAKAVRMDVPYNKQTPVTKTGEPVTRKETLVEEIGRFVPGNLDGLEKASKGPLQAVLSTLRQLSEAVEPADA